MKSYADLYTTVSQMGRLNYSYDSRYLFTFTVRRDGSSVFGENNKYGVFPSVALGWNIANEQFMQKSQNWLNNLKLRLSYGKSGNEAIGVYQTLMKLDVKNLLWVRILQWVLFQIVVWVTPTSLGRLPKLSMLV